jgi:DNA polymerase-3 subunit epsilon
MYAVIDVETTGGSPAVDRIIEIAVFVYDGEKVIEKFETLLNPNRKIDPWVVKLTGITPDMVANAPTFEDIHQKLFDITQDRIFVAHNVKFDFGMIRQEFKRLGIDYMRKQLDTVNLSRKAIPGQESYSLGTLCDNLNITLENRHRASGDAEATVRLLEMILQHQSVSRFIDIELRDGLDITRLPEHLTPAHIEILPEDAGVFFFKDESDNVLFVEGSKNIRRKVIQEINKAYEHEMNKSMLDRMRSIGFELSGNELVSKLATIRYQRIQNPEYNKKIKPIHYTHGIFLEYDSDGFAHLNINTLSRATEAAVLKFPSRATALKVLNKIITDNQLFAHLNLLKAVKEKGGNMDDFRPRYNIKIENSVKRFLYRNPNFFIVDRGIHPDEHSIIWVENGVYKGYGFYNPEVISPTVENLKEMVKEDEDSPDTQKLLRQFLRKGKDIKLVKY